MKRAEAILQLAKDIQDLREQKAAAEAELRGVSDALRERMARFSTLVPNGDELVDEEEVAVAPQIMMPKRMSASVLETMRTKPDAEWHVEDVSKALPRSNPPTVRSTMARMADAGTLVRTSHGRYRINVAGAMPVLNQPPAAEPAREEVKDDDRT
jgi:sarcosine oxidase gamma subunit